MSPRIEIIALLSDLIQFFELSAWGLALIQFISIWFGCCFMVLGDKFWRIEILRRQYSRAMQIIEHRLGNSSIFRQFSPKADKT